MNLKKRFRLAFGLSDNSRASSPYQERPKLLSGWIILALCVTISLVAGCSKLYGYVGHQKDPAKQAVVAKETVVMEPREHREIFFSIYSFQKVNMAMEVETGAAIDFYLTDSSDARLVGSSVVGLGDKDTVDLGGPPIPPPSHGSVMALNDILASNRILAGEYSSYLSEGDYVLVFENKSASEKSVVKFLITREDMNQSEVVPDQTIEIPPNEGYRGARFTLHSFQEVNLKMNIQEGAAVDFSITRAGASPRPRVVDGMVARSGELSSTSVRAGEFSHTLGAGDYILVFQNRSASEKSVVKFRVTRREYKVPPKKAPPKTAKKNK